MSSRSRQKSKRVVGLGLAVMDHVYVVRHGSLADTRVRYRERLVTPGGMMANAVSQSARLGVETHLLSTVGDDPDGRVLLRALRGHGVRTGGVVKTAAGETTVAAVFVDAKTGERRFVVPDRRALEARAPALPLGRIDANSVLMIDGHYPASTRRAVRLARRAGAPVVADFTRPKPGFVALLPHCTHPVLPLEFAREWAGGAEQTLRRLAKRHGATPAVTLGKQGVLAWLDGAPRRIPAPRVRAVDTTGAGDVFHGAFAATLARGWPLPLGLRFAAHAAAHSCTALGATTALFDADDWRAWQERYGPHA